jgi:signal transduction histidine kinase
MPERKNPWESRFHKVLLTLLWVALALGVFISFWEARKEAADIGTEAIGPDAIGAAMAASVYVLGSQILPRTYLRVTWIRELSSLVGVTLVMMAVSLSGLLNSPFLLLSLTPIMVAGVFGGFRSGLATAGLAAGVLVIISVGLDDFDLPLFFQWTGLYLLIGFTFGQARRLLLEEGERADALAAASFETTRRLERLERANTLLSRFAEIADTAELNPVTVGHAAIEGLAEVASFHAAVVALAGDDGPVVVARRGSEEPNDHRSIIPLSVGSRDVGMVVVISAQEPTQAEYQATAESLQPVALAFSNILLLQDIARRAIREERARLARDLHDEIGPSLASLGLALDLALLQHPADPDLADHLRVLRTSVGSMVEDVRSTVADLRMPEQPSLTEVMKSLSASVSEGDPEIDVRITERRPPRPSIAPDLTAIVTEAVRNAIRHSGSRIITVHGTVDFDEGSVTVHDEGNGFRRDKVPEGHFGLLGMEERAARIGAALNITSTRGGTAVTVTWGPD